MRHIESELQTACVTWFRYQYPKLGKLLFAVPNGGNRNAREGSILKKEGVTPGVSDLILLTPRGIYGSLCIEMKKPGESQKPHQKEWQQTVECHGNKYVVCRSFDQFRIAITSYLSQSVENSVRS